MKELIINADDFGYSPVFNQVILGMLAEGQGSSTTVMVGRVTIDQRIQICKLVEMCKKKKPISVGLHLEFEGCEGGQYWQAIEEQLGQFRELFNFGPSHLDMHKSAGFPDAYAVVTQKCKELAIPCRNWGQDTSGAKSTSEKVFFATVGSGSGLVKNFADIEAWVANLEDGKTYEICFHPGKYDPDCPSSLNKDREIDVQHIRQLQAILPKYGVRLISFRQL